MQGQRRSALNSFPDTVDLNQESLSNNANTDHPTAWNNALNSVESRLPHNSRSVNTWDSGESSSSANLRETRSEECQFEPILSRDRVGNGLGGNQVMWGPLSMQNSSDIGTSSSHAGYFLENDDGSDSSMGSWGSPCKRKALEDTSSQPFPFPGGNTSFFPQPELVPHITPARHNASSSLNISSSAVNSQGVSRSEQMNPRFGLGMRGAVSDVVPHIGPARQNDGSGTSQGSVAETAENSTRNYGARVNLGNQEQVPFNLPSPGNAVRRSSARSFHQSSRSSEFGQTASLPTNLSNLPNQPHLMCGPSLTRNAPFPWNGTHNSRMGSSSSSSLTLPGERGTGLREESGFRSTIRNNMENPMFGPVNETRNSIQEPTNWSLGSSSGPRGVGSSSRAAPGSSSRSFPTGWLPHHNSHQVRIPDFAPWALFSPSPVESEAGIPGAQFSQFAPGSSSSSSSPEETLMPSGASSQGHNQTFPRSALMMEVEDDDVNGWRSLAADIDGRQRLVSEIRQVLNAMRRGENLRAEDFMLFDPFINGVAELHDRHRDMRLDVDNMSYEELLALEEHIGYVNTGLSEETILQSMKQRKYLPFSSGAPSKLEPCCICQEEFVIGETIGTLDCGHDYHSNCIKQWLLQKNVCPICKMTALGN